MINHYRCERCATEWQCESDCSHDDDCPDCNLTMTPYKSTDMEAKCITPGDIVSIEGRTVVVHSVDWEEGDTTVLIRDAADGEKYSLWAGELVTAR